MTDTIPAPADSKRSIWLRGLLTLVMAVAFHISGTLLCLAAFIQFVLAAVGNTPNTQLVSLGQSLGAYLNQIAGFVSFATEEAPFPFSAWPSRR